MWTDGRYYQQARSQMDNNWTLMKEGLADTPTIGSWLAKNLKKGEQIGCDGNLLSSLAWSHIHVELQRNGKTVYFTQFLSLVVIFQRMSCDPSMTIWSIEFGRINRNKLPTK